MSNHGLIRLNIFISRISLGFWNLFIISLYLILLVSIQTFDVTGFKISLRPTKYPWHKYTPTHSNLASSVDGSSKSFVQLILVSGLFSRLSKIL
jgi:hypothetical protein